jgi:hypothetical protein
MKERREKEKEGRKEMREMKRREMSERSLGISQSSIALAMWFLTFLGYGIKSNFLYTGWHNLEMRISLYAYCEKLLIPSLLNRRTLCMEKKKKC